ncbi:hypothetical protein ACK37C_16455 [Aeromonas veronii]|uniref:hypothetical protein n=1 Tax=Aeromonas veronii TaxID=654 RepID=UPI00192002A6|nr:hypothetical protein [Aeromonas veronii]MBL0631193.1 hypothetical protein [Aeromonas veronii]
MKLKQYMAFVTLNLFAIGAWLFISSAAMEPYFDMKAGANVVKVAMHTMDPNRLHWSHSRASDNNAHLSAEGPADERCTDGPEDDRSQCGYARVPGRRCGIRLYWVPKAQKPAG